MVTIKKQNSKCWPKWEETGTLLLYSWECKMVPLLWETVWRYLKKLKMKLPYEVYTSSKRLEKKKEKLVSIVLAHCNPSMNVDLLVKLAESGGGG